MCLIVACSCSSTSDDTVVTYQSLSKAFIKIDVSRLSSDTLYVSGFALTNVPRGQADLAELTIASPGVYYTDITIDRPTSMIIEFDEERSQIFVKPGDTTFVGYDASALSFDDDINNYYAAKKDFFSYTDVRIPVNAVLTSRATFTSVACKTDSILGAELRFLEGYKLPEYFLNYERAEIEYLGHAFKVQLPHYIEMFKTFQDEVPETYFDFLEDVEVDNPEALASSRYFWFLDDYFLRNVEVAELTRRAGLSRRRFVDSVTSREAKTILSTQVLDVYTRYQVRHTSSMTPDEFFVLEPGDTLKNFSLINEIDSVVSMTDFKDRIVYIDFWATWCGPCIKDFPELNKLIDQYKSDKRITFMNICLESGQPEWKRSLKKHELGGVNLYAPGNWSNFLMKNFEIHGIPHHALIDRGNIVYRNHADGPYQARQQIDSLLEIRR